MILGFGARVTRRFASDSPYGFLGPIHFTNTEYQQ